MIEPSNTELAELPEASFNYIESLEQQNAELTARVARLEDAIRYSTDYLDDYKLNSIGFRPLKTKQDIEREKAINELVSTSRLFWRSLGSSNFMTNSEAAYYYDAGYHNGVKVGEKATPREVDNCIGAWNEDGYDTLWDHLLNNFDIFKKVYS